ncbi:hypothetical protein [Bordetella genomosp. 13]|uniref:hypothetical protein n=1 Tax=Bordetella genomosp. 13 TaxID=463040 RepID=UPI0011A8F8A9|nr:hypothetical protein [Bordetella genomosp. 13]
MPWMTDLYYDPQLSVDDRDGFSTRALRQICMPGTHDSGCYATHTLSLNVLSLTQTKNVLGQLAGGIRYFDIRPCFYGEQIYTYHGPLYYGDRIDGDEGILAQVKAFMDSLADTDRELVILNVAHFYKFDDARHEKLIATIQETLGRYLVDFNQNGIDLFNNPYETVLTDQSGNTGSRVAIVYDGALDEDRQPYITGYLARKGVLPPGFFTVSPKYTPQGNPIYIFDIYSNKKRVDDTFLRGPGMRADQFAKLTKRETFPYTMKPWGADLDSRLWTPDEPNGVASTLHVLSWTLTPQPREPITYAKKYANPALIGFLSDRQRWKNSSGDGGYYDALYNPQINIVYVDDFDSETHASPGSPWQGMAQPVAIAARINVGPVGPQNTW